MGVLDDVTVVELSIAIAAPSCCRTLAFHGAEVVKLESRTNPDVARLFGSAWAAGMDAGPYMDTLAVPGGDVGQQALRRAASSSTPRRARRR